MCYRWCHYLQSRDLSLKRRLGWVGGHKRCAVDDPNGVLINIATPGWNEYEEEVNCPQPTVKDVGNVEKPWVMSVGVALVMTDMTVSFVL